MQTQMTAKRALDLALGSVLLVLAAPCSPQEPSRSPHGGPPAAY